MYHDVQGVPEALLWRLLIFRLTYSLSTAKVSVAEPVISVIPVDLKACVPTLATDVGETGLECNQNKVI